MNRHISAVVVFGGTLIAALALTAPQVAHSASPSWNPRAAAAYMDGRVEWWLHWPQAQRDHDTACVSCHTALPYALARPALRAALGERDLAAPERAMLANIVKRVRLWREVEPFYPDQTRGLPKSSESRGTEAVLNTAALVSQDARTGSLSDEAKMAFANLWALQFKAGDLKGAWAWLNFHYEPWESNDGAYFGAAIAALSVGSAPGGYASSTEVREPVKSLREYLQRGLEKQTVFSRVMALWASTRLADVLTPDQQRAIVDLASAKQQADGGWSMASLGSWRRTDESELDTASDGYATGLIVLALQQAGVPKSDERIKKGMAWLVAHQDPADGKWVASSLNKKRDPASDAGKFMSDAATAYAVLALTQ